MQAILDKVFGAVGTENNRTDVTGNPLVAGGLYRMTSHGNSLVVEITDDLEHFIPVPSWFAGYFQIPAERKRLPSLAGHVQFVPFKFD